MVVVAEIWGSCCLSQLFDNRCPSKIAGRNKKMGLMPNATNMFSLVLTKNKYRNWILKNMTLLLKYKNIINGTKWEIFTFRYGNEIPPLVCICHRIKAKQKVIMYNVNCSWIQLEAYRCVFGTSMCQVYQVSTEISLASTTTYRNSPCILSSSYLKIKRNS